MNKKLIIFIACVGVLVAALSITIASCAKNDGGSGGNDSQTPHVCSFSEWETVTEPTCEESGTLKRTCFGCGEEETDIAVALGHSYDPSKGEFVLDGAQPVYEYGCSRTGCDKKNTVTVYTTYDVTDPTCEEGGIEKIIYGVSIDGQSYEKIVTNNIDPLGHSYSMASGVWKWNGYGEATYTVTCSRNYSHTHTYTAEMSSVTDPATCTANGRIIHTATVVEGENTYTDSKNETLYKLYHNYDYDNGTWEWDGHSSATYVARCTNDPSHTNSVTATVTASGSSAATCEQGSITTYTARVYAGSKSYTDTKTVETEPLGHDYDVSTASWKWMDNGAVAKLTFVCNNGEPHSAVYDAVVEYTVTVAPTCFDFGEAHARASVTVDGVTYTDEDNFVVEPIEHELDWYNGYWEWDEYSSATLIVPCTLGEPHNLEAYAIATEEVVYPDCYSDGYRKYTVYLELYGYELTDEKVVVLPATGHDFEVENVEWIGTDKVSAKVELICKNDNRHTVSEIGFAVDTCVKAPTCTITGVTLHTVTVEKDGQTFVVTKESEAPKNGHVFGASYCIYCDVAVYSTGLDFELNEDETGYVLVGVGSFAGETLSIPDTYEGLPVVAIKTEAFKGNKNIKTVYVSENIVKIEYGAFTECIALKNVYFTPNEHGLLDIGKFAFAYCEDLETLDIGNYVKTVRESAFGGCSSLTSVRIAAKNIYDGAFYSCPSLHSLEILDGVEYVGNIINEYTPIFSLTIPSTVKNINTELFSNPRLIEVKNLSSVNISLTSTLKNVYTDAEGESCLWIDPATGYVLFEQGDARYLMGHSGVGKTTVLPESCNKNSYMIYQYALMDVNFGHQPLYIPDAVTQIHRYAARNNKTLTVIWGCANVTDIGVYAFYGCSDLLSVTLGPKLNKIYDYAFEGCTRVCELINHSSINVQGGKIPMFYNVIDEITDPSVKTPAIYFVENDFVFYYRGEKCYLVSYYGKGDDTLPGQLTLPNLPKDWEINTYGIYKQAIRAIEGVTKIRIPGVVNQICTKAFTYEFDEIDILGTGLERIETEAFIWTAITEIYLPSSLEYIGANAFPETLEKADFVCIDGWKRGSSSSGFTSVNSSKFSDSTTAAKYLLDNPIMAFKRELNEEE